MDAVERPHRRPVRRWPALLALLWALVGSAPDRPAAAQEIEKGAFGLGLIFGEPTGIAAKLYLSNDTAVAGAAGLAVVGGGLHIHGDFLWHPLVLEDRDMFVMPVYVGVGARLFQRDGSSGSDFHVGARGVGGLLFDFKEIPLDVFVEVAGVLDYVFSEVANDSGLKLGLNLGAGARYYF